MSTPQSPYGGGPSQLPYGESQPSSYEQGNGQQEYGQPYNPQYSQQPGGWQNQYAQQPAPVNDSGSFGWAILGFFFPLVGLILFLVWKNTKPKCAKMSGIGALVGVIFNIACSFAVFPLFFL